MKTIINLSGTSPRIDFVINEFPEQEIPGLVQVETRAPGEEQVKMDLVYQITRALLRNITRGVYTENHDLVAVKDWFVEVFGDRWDADGFSNGQYPSVMDLAHSKDRVRAMAGRLMFIQTYQKLLNDSVALTAKGVGEGLEAYPGLLTIAYKGPAPEGEEGWAKHSLRIIKEIPREVLISLHDLFQDADIPRVMVGTPAAARGRPLMAHRVTPDAVDDVIRQTQEAQLQQETPRLGGSVPMQASENQPADTAEANAQLRMIDGGRTQAPVHYAQNFREMDFADLSPRDKALVAAALERAATMNNQDILSKMFSSNRANSGNRVPYQRHQPFHARPAPRYPQHDQRTN